MTSTVEGASLNMNELSLSLYSQAEAHEQAGSDQMQTPDFLVLARQLSGDMILCATEAQILLLLPSILHRIEVCKVPHEKRGAMDALRIRLCSSRRLKLRFLLLRKHDAFRTLSSRLRYSSRAYDVPIVTTACSSSHIDIEDDMTAMPQSICVPVDMVGKNEIRQYVDSDRRKKAEKPEFATCVHNGDTNFFYIYIRRLISKVRIFIET